MSVLVDTSVWVDFVNGYPSAEAEQLAERLRTDADIVTCGLVVAEFFQGLRRDNSIVRFMELFRAIPWLTPQEPDTYLAAAELFRALRRRGVTVRSTVDCVIARLAQENGCALLSRDRDMAAILDSGLVAVARP